MNPWSQRIRQFHRWMSILFTLCVIANFAVMGRPFAVYVGMATLVPLFLLLATGLCMFVQPYLRKAA